MTDLFEHLRSPGMERLVDVEGVCESYVVESMTVTEAKDKGKGILGTFELTAAKAGIINRNRRLYSEEVFREAVKKAQPFIKDGTFLGECDHPWGGGTLERAAARFTKVWMDGTYVKAEGVILAVDHGKRILDLLEGGVGVQVSTRGYGTILRDKRTIQGVEIEIGVVQKDYFMEGIDFVLFGSNPAGKVTGHTRTTESTEHSQETQPMTIEQLRKDHATLVAAIEAEARTGYVSEADRDAAVNTAKEAAKKEALESEEAKAPFNAFVKTITDALAPHVPELKAKADEAQKSAEAVLIEQLTAKVTELTSKVEEGARVATEATNAEKAEKATKELAAHVTTALEGVDEKHRANLRPRLEKLTTKEAVTEAVADFKGLLALAGVKESVAGTTGTTGTGKVDEGTGGEQADGDDEQTRALKEHQRRIARLPRKA